MYGDFKITGFADEISPSLGLQMSVLKKLGISNMEIRGVDGKNLVEYSIEQAKEIKSRLDDGGIGVSCIGSPIGKIKITDDFAPHMELFKHCVEIAHTMGTSNIRLFSFYIPQGERAIYKDEVMERLGQFADYGAANNVLLLHENEKGIYGEKSSECLEIMENFYSDNFKAIFDFANFVQAKNDTMEAYEKLEPYIAYIHIKDARMSDGEVVPPGYGDGNLGKILKKLKETGYKGFLSLEPHLTDFTGFSSLEEGGTIGTRMTGEEAFTLAYKSLLKLLGEI